MKRYRILDSFGNSVGEASHLQEARKTANDYLLNEVKAESASTGDLGVYELVGTVIVGTAPILWTSISHELSADAQQVLGDIIDHPGNFLHWYEENSDLPEGRVNLATVELREAGLITDRSGPLHIAEKGNDN